MSLCAAVLLSCSAAYFLMLGKIYSLLTAYQSKRHDKVLWQGMYAMACGKDRLKLAASTGGPAPVR